MPNTQRLKIFTLTDANQNVSKKKKKGLSLFTASVFIVGSIAGGGILSLPKALTGTGWWGILIITICCINAGYGGVYLGKCWVILERRWPHLYKGKHRKPYPAIGERAYGKWMSHVVSVLLNLNLIGTSIVVLVLVSGIIETLTSRFIHNFTLCSWIPIVALILLPMMFFGSPEDFWPVAFAAMFATLLGTILLIIALILNWNKHDNASYESPTFKSFSLSFGTVLFCYNGATQFPTFQNDMKEREKFPKAVFYGFIALLILYLPLPILGFFIYGDKVQDNIINSIDNNVLQIIISICFALHLFFAFLIIVNPVLLEFEEMFKIPNKFGWKRCLLRTVIMALIVFIGETVPNFGKILNFVGGLTVTLMSFLMPTLYYWRLKTQEELKDVSLFTKIIYVQIIIIGLLGGAAATYSAILDIVLPGSFVYPCYVYHNSTK